jgi:hypothetical protein
VIVDGKLGSVLEGAQLTQSAITRSFMPLAAEPVAAKTPLDLHLRASP